MDNNRLIVVSATKTDFDLAIQLAFRHNSKAVGWSLWKPKREEWNKDRPEDLLGVCHDCSFLVLHWYTEAGVNPLPVPVDHTVASTFAWNWLGQQNYGIQPDHDGSNHPGFVMFNDVWGHVGGNHSAIIAIGPAWAMAGK